MGSPARGANLRAKVRMRSKDFEIAPFGEVIVEPVFDGVMNQGKFLERCWDDDALAKVEPKPSQKTSKVRHGLDDFQELKARESTANVVSTATKGNVLVVESLGGEFFLELGEHDEEGISGHREASTSRGTSLYNTDEDHEQEGAKSL